VYTTLATDKVRFVGDPVVLVVADSRYLAEDAGEMVRVDYEELPAIVTHAAALDPANPPIFSDLGSNVLARSEVAVFGDVEGVFARADKIVRAKLRQHRHQPAPIECRGVVCSFDPESEQLTVVAATQGVHMLRSMLAARLGLPESKVRATAGDVGGSF